LPRCYGEDTQRPGNIYESLTDADKPYVLEGLVQAANLYPGDIDDLFLSG